MGMVCFKPEEQNIKPQNETSFFDLKANDIFGRRIDFYIYKNRSAFLLVNVASNCSLAKDNYKMLNELYSQYREHGLEIMAFPCNQFGNSEPKSNDEIQASIRKKHEVTFSLFEKIEVNGMNTHPVYKYLRNQPLLTNEKTGKCKTIPESFTICLLNKEGKLVRYFKPSKDFQELKKSVKRMLTHQRVTTKRLITARSIN